MLGQNVPAPKIGDYQSRVVSGNWNTSSSWSKYSSSGWVNATDFPGQNTTAIAQGNYNVFIKPGDVITFSAAATYYFGSVYILSCYQDPATQNCLRFPTKADFDNTPQNVKVGEVRVNGVDIKLLGSNQNVYIYGGTLRFPSNNSGLYLLTGNSLVITNYSGGVGSNATYGINGVQPVTSQDCSGQRRIYFVNSVSQVDRIYAICYAQAGDYTFQGLNSMGGSLFSVIEVSRNEICAGQNITLSGSYTGVIPTGALVEYLWTFVSGPTPVSFNSSYSPVPVSSHTLTLPNVGTYIFRLETRNEFSSGFYINSIEDVSVTVYPVSSSICGCYKNPTIDSSVNPSSFGITSLKKGNNNQTIDNWPIGRQGGAMVLESKTKGLVINRVSDVSAIQNPVEGMIIYDTTAKKLKVYKPVAGGGMGWKSVEDPACPTL